MTLQSLSRVTGRTWIAWLTAELERQGAMDAPITVGAFSGQAAVRHEAPDGQVSWLDLENGIDATFQTEQVYP